MSLLRLNRHPSPKDLRVFASLWLLCFGALAYTSLRRDGAFTETLAVLAGLVGGLGLLIPPAVRWIYLVAIYVTFPIGFVMSHVILAGVYFLVFTPIGLIMRACGHDPLHRRAEPNRRSYWEAKTATRSPASYLRQH